MPVCISNYIHLNCGGTLLIHFQILTVQTLKFGKGQVIPSHIVLGIYSAMHTGIRVNVSVHVGTMAPDDTIVMIDPNISSKLPQTFCDLCTDFQMYGI